MAVSGTVSRVVSMARRGTRDARRRPPGRCGARRGRREGRCGRCAGRSLGRREGRCAANNGGKVHDGNPRGTGLRHHDATGAGQPELWMRDTRGPFDRRFLSPRAISSGRFRRSFTESRSGFALIFIARLWATCKRAKPLIQTGELIWRLE